MRFNSFLQFENALACSHKSVFEFCSQEANSSAHTSTASYISYFSSIHFNVIPPYMPNYFPSVILTDVWYALLPMQVAICLNHFSLSNTGSDLIRLGNSALWKGGYDRSLRRHALTIRTLKSVVWIEWRTLSVAMLLANKVNSLLNLRILNQQVP